MNAVMCYFVIHLFIILIILRQYFKIKCTKAQGVQKLVSTSSDKVLLTTTWPILTILINYWPTTKIVLNKLTNLNALIFQWKGSSLIHCGCWTKHFPTLALCDVKAVPRLRDNTFFLCIIFIDLPWQNILQFLQQGAILGREENQIIPSSNAESSGCFCALLITL